MGQEKCDIPQIALDYFAPKVSEGQASKSLYMNQIGDMKGLGRAFHSA